MLSVAIDILHWIAGAVLALVGIGYDRVEDCAPAVRQQTFEEARFMDEAVTLHFLGADTRIEQTRSADGTLVFTVQANVVQLTPANVVQDTTACASLPGNLPSAPPLPVLRL